MKNSKDDPYTGSATAGDVANAMSQLLRDFADAATVLPVATMAQAITDLAAATAHADAGRRGDAMRTFMRDLHRELVDAHDCLQRARAAPTTKPPAPRVALVG